jgi:TonB family protein
LIEPHHRPLRGPLRPECPAPRPPPSLWAPGLLAAAVHVLGLMIAIRGTRTPAVPPHTLVAPSSARIAQAVADARRARSAAEAPRPRARPKRQPPQPAPVVKLEGQVVDVAPSADARPPDDARLLAEHNARAEREQRSRHASPDYKNVMPEPSVTRRGTGSVPRTAPLAPHGGAAMEIPRQAQQDRLALRHAEAGGVHRNHGASERIDGNSDRLHIAGGDSQAPAPAGSPAVPTLSMADLVPQMGTLARLPGGPSNDALEDLPVGEGTFLNAREFKYAAFFNRMKQRIAQHWRPLAEYQRRDPTGSIYGTQPRVTVVAVSLDAHGALAELKVHRGSGVEFLDREAIAAFRQAAPFVHPPHGLVDADGRIAFQFGFHLDIGGPGGFDAPY